MLASGEVVETGTHDELVGSGGLYSRMWEDYNKAAKWRIASDGEVA